MTAAISPSSATGRPARRSPPPTKPTRRTKGFRVIAWIEANCCFTTGEWIGRPFALLPWQKRLIIELFELQPDGLRRYRWAYIQVSKKNGKTELAAALALYFLIGDEEPSPLVVCAAASDDQADLVFGAAKKMCELSPTLRLVTEGGRFEKEIQVPSSPGAKLKRVAAAAGTNDGQNIHAVICDELHEWAGPRGESVWNVLTNGTGARRQPMVLQITTAGYDTETICGRQYTYAQQVVSGEAVDARYYSLIVEAPAGADHRDPAVWEAANPSWGTTVFREFFEDQVTKKTESVFRRYFLDQWVASEDLWLPFGTWDACRSDRGLDPKLPISVGIDIGRVHDATAVVIAQQQPDGRVVVRARAWSNPFPERDSRHADWRMDIEGVREHLRSLRLQFPVPAAQDNGRWLPGPVFCFDPWGFGESAQSLSEEGLTMVEVSQTDARIIPATRRLYDLAVTGRIAHDGDSIMAAHVANVVAVERGSGWRLKHPANRAKRIDTIQGLVNALTELPGAVQPRPRVGAFLA